jgi:hypothetical protein
VTRRESDQETNKLLRLLITKIGKFMPALDNLTAATTRLAASVDKAVTVITTPPTGGATEVQVQAAADVVNAQSDKLDKATAPPAP